MSLEWIGGSWLRCHICKALQEASMPVTVCRFCNAAEPVTVWESWETACEVQPTTVSHDRGAYEFPIPWSEDLDQLLFHQTGNTSRASYQWVDTMPVADLTTDLEFESDVLSVVDSGSDCSSDPGPDSDSESDSHFDSDAESDLIWDMIWDITSHWDWDCDATSLRRHIIEGAVHDNNKRQPTKKGSAWNLEERLARLYELIECHQARH